MKITSFKVSNDKSSLLLEIDDATTATNLFLWDKEHYNIDEHKIDLSTKLDGTASQSIVITLADLSISEFDGVYFIDLIDPNDKVCGIVGELTRYKECILDKLLSYQGYDSCLEINYPEVLNSFNLLYTIEKAIELNLAQETLTIIFSLDKFCSNDCKGCGEYKSK